MWRRHLHCTRHSVKRSRVAAFPLSLQLHGKERLNHKHDNKAMIKTNTLQGCACPHHRDWNGTIQQREIDALKQL